MRRYFQTLMLLVCMFLCSCEREQETGPDTSRTAFKVVVIAPSGESREYGERLQRIADWFTANLQEGQRNFDKGVRLDFEWYDESSMDAEELELLSEDLAYRDDVAAIIGPFFSKNVDIVASNVYLSGIPLIAPAASADELQRKYSVTSTGLIRTPFLWCISSSDVIQSQLLLDNIAGATYDPQDPSRAASVCLISSDDIYGQTFHEWMPFQAAGMGIDMKLNISYNVGSKSSVSDCMDRALALSPDYIICAPGSFSDAALFAALRGGEGSPQILFTDAAFSPSFLIDPQAVEQARGTAMYDDPRSGFRYAYRSRFGEMPIPTECMLYDAFLLTAIACNVSIRCGETDLNTIIKSISNGPQGRVYDILDCPNWSAEGIGQYLLSFDNSNFGTDFFNTPTLFGVTGQLVFDYSCATTRENMYYSVWKVTDGRFETIDCVSGSRDESMSKWNSISYLFDQGQTFSDNIDITYGPLKDRWALLVCSSREWKNYRHASDVLFMYHCLKDNGYDDDHIILVLDDVYSTDSRNIYPGEIRHNDGEYEENLLDGVQIDYRMSDLTPDDICEILLGHGNGRLHTVLETDSCSNVIFYWTGHGSPESFIWSGTEGFTADHMRSTVSAMASGRRYRKMLVLAEPCYSASVLEALEGIPGVLGIASSRDTETSFADSYNYQMKVWMNDRFTTNLVNNSARYTITYFELYMSLWESTLGSHVSIINADGFANLYTERIMDLLGPL